MKRILLIIIPCLLLSRVVISAVYDPSSDWRTIKTKHFEIHYLASIEAVAQRVAGFAEEAHETLSPKFGWKPWGRTQVVLVDNNDNANGLATVLPYNLIELRVASPDPDSPLSNYDDWLRTLVFHEYTHVLHIDQVGGIMRIPRILLGKVVSPNGTTPGWIKEGLATYIETYQTTQGRGRASFSEMMLRTAVLENKFPPIDQAAGVHWKWPYFQTQYIFGEKFLEYLADKYGEEKLYEFSRRMSRSPFLYAINRQAKKVYGKSFYKLWNEWKSELKEKYSAITTGCTPPRCENGLEVVAAHETVLSSPAISPDGKKLVYVRSSPIVGSQLRMKDLETGEDKILKRKISPTHISFSPDGNSIVYSTVGTWKTYYQYSDLHIYKFADGKVERITKGQRASDPAFSPDGKKIAFVKQDAGRGALAILDVETKEIIELRIEDLGLRGEKQEFTQFADPAWSPDGKWIAVSSWGQTPPTPTPVKTEGSDPTSRAYERTSVPAYETGQWDIYLAEIKNQKPKIKNESQEPNSKFQTTEIYQLTNDTAIDSHPVWSPDGKVLYFVSDRSGVSNVYSSLVAPATEAPAGKRRSPLEPPPRPSPPRGEGEGGGRRTTNDERRITNVLTGVFQPVVSPDGKTLYVQYYNGEGYDIRSLSLAEVQSSKFKVQSGTPYPRNPRNIRTSELQNTRTDVLVSPFFLIEGEEERTPNPEPRTTRDEGRNNPPLPPFSKGGVGGLANLEDSEPTTINDKPSTIKKYSPLGKSLFLPRFVLPNVATLDNAVYMSAMTGGQDPLKRHTWLGGVTYRTDIKNYVGYFFNYQYTRYKPRLSVGVMDYAVNFGDLTFILLQPDNSYIYDIVHFYEGRRRVYGGIGVPWSKQYIGLSYFWENRRSEAKLLDAEAAALNLGNFNGFSVSYAYGDVERHPASISYENGRRLRTNFTITDGMLGSAEKNEQRIFVGDYREYINLPWWRHVFAVRTSGGMTWGDQLLQGTFTMGGALGEGAFGGGDSLYYFPLRGLQIATFSGTRAMLVSGEYRIPLISPQRGLGTWPIFLNNIHFAPFADYGNIWWASTNTWGEGKHFFDDFFLGTGAELRGDFVVGHGLPVTGRLGYGIIVVNRDRFGTLTDPLLKTSAKYGMMILQLGTAF